MWLSTQLQCADHHTAIPAIHKNFTLKHPVFVTQKLEYLAINGRTSMAAFRQLSTDGQKFDPESLYEPM